MGWAQTIATGYVFEECCSCSVQFAMTTELHNRRQSDGRNFYCPNGHEQHYVGPTPDQKRVKELERELARERERAESATRQRSWAEQRAKGANIAAGKAKAQMRRTLDRVHAGVCPHCHRTFKQLAAHMATKHHEPKQ